MVKEPPVRRCAVCDELCLGKVCKTCQKKGMKLALMTVSHFMLDNHGCGMRG